MSAFCFSKFLDEFEESCHYIVTASGEAGTWIVRRAGVVGLDDEHGMWKACDHMTPARMCRVDRCSCRMVNVMGYGPCRHMAKVIACSRMLGYCLQIIN